MTMRPDISTPVVEINHLARRFGSIEAVRDLNLRVEAGRCYGLFGRNGAGKTTTIKCLLNLVQTEEDLLERFRLDARHNANHLSKGQRTQLALIAAVCPEPDLLVLDEPTSGLDPIVRREFIRAVIGAYQEGDPGRRTVLVSTHLISEFEGLIDEFTILDDGRDVFTLSAGAARERHQKGLEEIFVSTLQPQPSFLT